MSPFFIGGVFSHLVSTVVAGTLYSDKELWAAGDLWKKTQAEWNLEKARHTKQLKKISQSKLSLSEKNLRLQQEYRYHKSESIISEIK